MRSCSDRKTTATARAGYGPLTPEIAQSCDTTRLIAHPTGELGTDGVVRVAAANLCENYVRLVQQVPEPEPGKKRFYAPKLERDDSGSARAPKMPLRVQAPYPNPARVGLSFNPKECALITQVLKNTPAAQAKLKPGDRVIRMGGQSILSIADVEWALYGAPDAGKLSVEVIRNGSPLTLSLPLRPGWRTRN